MVAKQALSDAASANATGALLATADTDGESPRRVVLLSKVFCRGAHGAESFGLDPGPEIPAAGQRTATPRAEQKVRVGDQEADGVPTHGTGRGHYYGGGYYNGQPVPGGWYSFPSGDGAG